MIDIYGGKDPRDIPVYSIGNAARYLKIPQSTIRCWVVGYQYQTIEGTKEGSPLIEVKTSNPLRLTFFNLVEVHVLRAIRQNHKINLANVRITLDYMSEQLSILHPLASTEFYTDGVDLFIEKYGSLINASKKGRLALKDSFKSHLERIEPDDRGLAITLYPFTRSKDENNPKIVAIDPRIAFGRLVIVGTGIPTQVIAERYYAGDSIEELVKDYGCDHLNIEEAIRCEMNRDVA